MGIRTALVVDDSRSARYILQRLLERRDIRVDQADSAQQALSYLREHRPDVVFMDEMMPDMEGHEAIDQLAADPSTQAIPIIMYTARDYAESAAPPLHSGVIGVLSKPFTPEDVNELLEKLEGQGANADLHTPPDVARLIRSGDTVLDQETESGIEDGPEVSASITQVPVADKTAIEEIVIGDVIGATQNLETLRNELTSTMKSEVRLAVDQWLGEALENQIAEQLEAQNAVWRDALKEVRAEHMRFQGQILEQRIPRLLDLLENRLDQRITLSQHAVVEKINNGALGPLQRSNIASIVRSEVEQSAQRPARQAARKATTELMRSDMSALNLRVERVRRRMNAAIGYGVTILLGCVALAYFAGTVS
ncbi:MAG: response regulator [Gammaproteobacteria bacterium]|nr:response regulator [Gammaproteobacteria bacterium]